ncbi:MAG: Lpg1974 family pore-forming outer membrane protein [Chlamydiota bacterium]
MHRSLYRMIHFSLLLFSFPLIGSLETKTADPSCLRDGWNAPAQFDQGDLGGYLTKTFLIWKVEGDSTAPGVVVLGSGAEEILLEKEYRLGFHLGGGYHLPYGNWQIELGYSYLPMKATSQEVQSDSSAEEIAPFWAKKSQDAPSFLSENSVWTFSAQSVTASLLRRYYVGQKLLVALETGLRSWIVQQNYDAKYAGVNAHLETHSKAHLWNLGPRTSLHSDWFIGSGLRFFGHIGGSIGYTKAGIDHLETKDENATLFSLSDERPFLAPTSEIGVGLGWGASFLERGLHLDASLRYDLFVLYGQNVMKSLLEPFVENFSRGSYDVYLHGFSLMVRSDF